MDPTIGRLTANQNAVESASRVGAPASRPVLSPVEAAERALARNPNDERAKYLLAMERQREAQQAADHADKVRRFERALDPDPRSHLSVIDGGKKADGGSVYPDMIAQALMIARALSQR